MALNPTTLDTKFEYSVDLTNAPDQDEVDLTAIASETDAVVTVKKGGSKVICPPGHTIDEGDNTITVDGTGAGLRRDEDLHADDQSC